MHILSAEKTPKGIKLTDSNHGVQHCRTQAELWAAVVRIMDTTKLPPARMVNTERLKDETDLKEAAGAIIEEMDPGVGAVARFGVRKMFNYFQHKGS